MRGILSGLLSPYGDCHPGPGAEPPSSSLRGRMKTQASLRSRCCQRDLPQDRAHNPVQLVVFDVDETLTLVSYMLEEDDPPEVQEELVKVNFESPWVDGSRREHLKKMLSHLRVTIDDKPRALAILSRNNKGAKAVLHLLEAAGLACYFYVIWTLPWRVNISNGAYQDRNGKWHFFDPPIQCANDHKADVLSQIVEKPSAWFPTLADGSDERLNDLRGLNLEGILLVDDQRQNFQSPTGAQVLRYCKVARYDACYEGIGFVKDMGGLGAHDLADYETLKLFVDNPALCKIRLYCACTERAFQGRELKPPVDLVIFEFDETLTLATFFPDSDAFSKDVNWDPKSLASSDWIWTKEDLLLYNFETPFVHGSRVSKLRDLLTVLTQGRGKRRTLAVITTNEHGPIAVLNLLRLANLAEFFHVIWRMGSSDEPFGLYRHNDEWRCFSAPMPSLPAHKADVMQSVVQHPDKWIPQLLLEDCEAHLAELRQLKLEKLVLVDSERASFQNAEGAYLYRYCKVARYDEVYRECGALHQMGGLGAHTDMDYEDLKSFVQSPWTCPETKETLVRFPSRLFRGVGTKAASPERRQRVELEKLPKNRAPRKRKALAGAPSLTSEDSTADAAAPAVAVAAGSGAGDAVGGSATAAVESAGGSAAIAVDCSGGSAAVAVEAAGGGAAVAVDAAGGGNGGAIAGATAGSTAIASVGVDGGSVPVAIGVAGECCGGTGAGKVPKEEPPAKQAHIHFQCEGL